MEYLDVIDEQDTVIQSLPRDEVYAKNLRHRIVHVLIFHPDGRMALQLRSATVNYCPLHWSTAVGGHVQSGESYEQAAQREMREEIGIIAPLTILRKDVYHVEGRPEKFLTTFTTTYDGDFTYTDGEAHHIEFFTNDQVRQMLTSDEKFVPEVRFLLKAYYNLA